MKVFNSKNNKGISLVELMVGILILTGITMGMLKVIQTLKTTRYINQANQDIVMLQSNIFDYLTLKNDEIKENGNNGSITFEKDTKKEFLNLFPNNSLTINNEKKCYQIEKQGKNFNFINKPIDGDELVEAKNNLLNSYGENSEDSEYGYSYPTILCVVNGYDINDINGNIKLLDGPILVTIFSNFIVSGEIHNIHGEKKYYFNEM